LKNFSHFFNISVVGLSAIADFLAVDDDPAIADVHAVKSNHGLALVVVYAVACTNAVAGNLFFVGPTVTHIHAVALVRSVAGTHSVAGVSAINSSIQLHDVTA
jgi:hypothetical protein